MNHQHRADPHQALPASQAIPEASLPSTRRKARARLRGATSNELIAENVMPAAPGAGRPGFPAIIALPEVSWLKGRAAPAMLLHFAITFALIGLVLLSGEIFGWMPWQGLAAVVIFAYLLIALLLSDALVFFLTFSLSATLAPMVASNTYIEFGNFISEQSVSGIPTGSTSRLVFYCVVFYLGVFVLSRALINRLRVRASDEWTRKFCLIARWGHAAVLVAAIGLLLVHGSPLLRGEDRFAYWASLPEVFNRLPYLIAIVCFLTVCAAAVRPSLRTVSWAAGLILSSIIVLLLFSEKFTGLFQVFLLSVIAAYTVAIFHRQVRLRLWRLLVLCVVAALALLSSAAMGYIVFYDYTLGTVLPKLMDRVLALHGHVWFGMDRSLQEGQPLGPTSALVEANSDGLSGIQQLMYLVAPSDFVDRMIAGGLRFANAGFPLPVWTLGYGWAAIYFLIAGVLAGAVLAYLMFTVAKLRIVSIFFALNALRQVGNAFLVGDVTDLYKPLSLITWAWILGDLAYTWYCARSAARRTKLAS